LPIDLHYVDELIEVRTQQHGGGRGAPPLAAGHRVGASINRSCIVMLSALLQGHIEDVFIDCSRRVLPNLAKAEALDAYRKSFRRWGNPSGENIQRLFQRIGVLSVLDGLSWRNCPNDALIRRLGEINQIRNGIAHGRAQLTLDGQPFSLRLEQVRRYRDFIENFGERFSAHALARTTQAAEVPA
jgi:hypothetical protein